MYILLGYMDPWGLLVSGLRFVRLWVEGSNAKALNSKPLP